MERCLTVKEVADFLGCTERHVFYLIDMGSVECWKIGGIWRFYKGAVEQYAGSKNVRRINKKSPGYPKHEGGGGFLELFTADSVTVDRPRRSKGLSSGGGRLRLEHQPGRSFQIPVKKIKPVGQLELFEAC